MSKSGEHHREERQRPHIPLPKETLEDTDLLVAAELEKKNWVDLG